MKWEIRRHRPRRIPDWEKADRNHGKRWSNKAKRNEAKRDNSRTLEVGFLDLVTKQGNADKAKTATMMIGQCARKAKLSAEAARALVRSASLERGEPVYAYRCRWCGQHHLTSHPEPGETYDFFCDGRHFR